MRALRQNHRALRLVRDKKESFIGRLEIRCWSLPVGIRVTQTFCVRAIVVYCAPRVNRIPSRLVRELPHCDTLHKSNLLPYAAVGCTTGSPRPLGAHLLRDAVLGLCPLVRSDTLARSRLSVQACGTIRNAARRCGLLEPSTGEVRGPSLPRIPVNESSDGAL